MAGFFSNLFGASQATATPTTSVTITQQQMLAFLATLEKMGFIDKTKLTPDAVIEIGNLLALQGVTVPQNLIAAVVAG